jgi:hypothetical protein
MTRTAVLLLAALFSQGAFCAAPMVEAFQADPIPLFDEQGKQEGTLARKDAPPTPIPALQYAEATDQVQIELAGKKVWLDAQDVKLNPPPSTVTIPCVSMSKGGATDKQNNSTMGFGAGCNQ